MDRITESMARVSIEELYPDDIDDFAQEEAERQRRERDAMDDADMDAMEAYFFSDDLPF